MLAVCQSLSPIIAQANMICEMPILEKVIQRLFIKYLLPAFHTSFA